jgi:hypothetical protein
MTVLLWSMSSWSLGGVTDYFGRIHDGVERFFYSTLTLKRRSVDCVI